MIQCILNEHVKLLRKFHKNNFFVKYMYVHIKPYEFGVI